MSDEFDRKATLDSLIELCDAAVREEEFFYSTGAEEAESADWGRTIKERVLADLAGTVMRLADDERLLSSLDDEIASILGQSSGSRPDVLEQAAPLIDPMDVSHPSHLRTLGNHLSTTRAAAPKKLRSVLTALTWLGGGRSELLAATPSVQQQYAAIGWSLLTSGFISLASMAAALRIAFEIPIGPVSIAVGATWAILTVGLERALTLTRLEGARANRLASSFIPRIALAGTLGMILSIPIAQTVFEQEIVTKFRESRSIQLEAKAVELQTKLKNANAFLSGTGVTTDPEVVAAQKQFDETTSELLAARQLLLCEMYGTPSTPGCSGRPGEGPSADLARSRVVFLEQQRSTAAGQLAAATNSAHQRYERESSTVAAEKERLTLESQLLTQQKAAIPVALPGLLERQQILSEEASISSSAFLLCAVLSIISLLPVALRLGTVLSGGTIQDKVTRIEEETFELLQEGRLAVERAIGEMEIWHVREQFEEDVRFAGEAQNFVRERRRAMLYDFARNDLTQADEENVMNEFLAVLQRVREIDFMRGMAWNTRSPVHEAATAETVSNVRDIRSAIRRAAGGFSERERRHG